MHPIIKKILDARVYDITVKTPLDKLERLSKRLDNTVLLKREDYQQVFSFKLRGAYNRMAHLSEEEKRLGVLCASAGNHAQGVALSAKKLGIKASIVMPKNTPPIKVQSVKQLGGHVVLHGETYDEACDYAFSLVEKQGSVFIHPFDDDDVIAGQGTIAKELLEESPELDAVFIPVGGGGLAAGMATYLRFLRPEMKIIGVEPVESPTMHDSIKAKKRVVLPQVGIFADGVAVKQVGKRTFELCRQLLDEIVLVDTDETCAAIKDVFEDCRAISEPSGALALAGLKKYVQRENWTGKRVATVLSGANINFDRLRYVAERAEIGEMREAIFAVTIPERPGAFKELLKSLGSRSVTEFNYRFNDDRSAQVFLGLATPNGLDDRAEILLMLGAQDYKVTDLTMNEMAKTHIRYMVGGRAFGLENERLFHFEFPERQGALLRFLERISNGWNISLFHFRNHGSDYDRVLCGIQVPDDDLDRFHKALDKIGYVYREETDNPAYKFFLG